MAETTVQGDHRYVEYAFHEYHRLKKVTNLLHGQLTIGAVNAVPFRGWPPRTVLLRDVVYLGPIDGGPYILYRADYLLLGDPLLDRYTLDFDRAFGPPMPPPL